MTPATIIRTARQAAGLSQSELATRLRTTQSAIARLERPGSNPRIETLDAAVRATGHRLELQPVQLRAASDEDQIRARLELSPAERLAAFQSSQRNVRRLARQAKRAPRGSN
jgi:transcriptional regulator with XRE-family HTH domain